MGSESIFGNAAKPKKDSIFNAPPPKRVDSGSVFGAKAANVFAPKNNDREEKDAEDSRDSKGNEDSKSVEKIDKLSRQGSGAWRARAPSHGRSRPASGDGTKDNKPKPSAVPSFQADGSGSSIFGGGKAS